MAQFWLEYQGIARKDKLDTVSTNRFFTEIDEVQNKVTDGLLRLLQIDLLSHLEFGPFLEIIVAVGLFDEEAIVKFCFYVFDSDKNGFVDSNEFEVMLEVLYNVDRDGEMKGFINAAKSRLDISEDGRIDFAELEVLAGLNPNFFYPFFRIQNKITGRYMGRDWWEKKKALLSQSRDSLENDRERLTILTLERIRKRRIRRQMGVFIYYLFPWRRSRYDEMYPKKEGRRREEVVKEEEKEKKRKERLELQRLKDISAKNLETREWHTYLERKGKGGGNEARNKRDPSDRQQRRELRQQRKAKELKGSR